MYIFYMLLKLLSGIVSALSFAVFVVLFGCFAAASFVCKLLRAVVYALLGAVFAVFSGGMFCIVKLCVPKTRAKIVQFVYALIQQTLERVSKQAHANVSKLYKIIHAFQQPKSFLGVALPWQIDAAVYPEIAWCHFASTYDPASCERRAGKQESR